MLILQLFQGKQRAKEHNLQGTVDYLIYLMGIFNGLVGIRVGYCKYPMKIWK